MFTAMLGAGSALAVVVDVTLPVVAEGHWGSWYETAAAMSIVEIRALGGAAISGRKLPTGNCHHAFFLDLVTIYDAKGKSAEERMAIADLTKRVVDKARAVGGLSIDLSGTHSQPDDPDRSAVAAVIFGTEDMAAMVKATKQQVDPHNRFRFHPFAKFVS